MSLAILIVSTLLPSVWLLLIDITVYDRSKGCLYNAETGTFYPAVGFALSIAELRLPIVACIQIHDAWSQGSTAVVQEEIDRPRFTRFGLAL